MVGLNGVSLYVTEILWFLPLYLLYHLIAQTNQMAKTRPTPTTMPPIAPLERPEEEDESAPDGTDVVDGADVDLWDDVVFGWVAVGAPVVMEDGTVVDAPVLVVEDGALPAGLG
ncbi:hypothetical protein HDV00_002534 [Rhizophlyctis rosea]|nr:hypothetical protein HDV00_002534 [Rhizophlyctis rosea]